MENTININTAKKNIKELEKIQKEWEISAAKIMVGPLVKNQYQNIKTKYGNLISAEINNFNQIVSNTKNLLEITIDGKTFDAIINNLSKIARNSNDLINGVNSIKTNSSAVSAINFSAIHNLSAFYVAGNAFRTIKIKMLDNFIKTRDLVLEAIPVLMKIKETNEQLLNVMESEFETVIERIAEIFPRLSFQEVKDIATDQGLLPQDSIDLSAVDAASSLADKKIKEIDRIADNISVAYILMQSRDKNAFISSGLALQFAIAKVNAERKGRLKDALDAIQEETPSETTPSETPSDVQPPTPVQEPPVDLPLGLPTNFNTSDNPYPFGQCTWYAWGRRSEIGKPIPWFSGDSGNALNWITSAQNLGLKTSDTPSIGAVVVFQPDSAGTSSELGHVAIVEKIEGDSILISESNVDGLATGEISFRSIPLGAGMSFIE